MTNRSGFLTFSLLCLLAFGFSKTTFALAPGNPQPAPPETECEDGFFACLSGCCPDGSKCCTAAWDIAHVFTSAMCCHQNTGEASGTGGQSTPEDDQPHQFCDTDLGVCKDSADYCKSPNHYCGNSSDAQPACCKQDEACVETKTEYDGHPIKLWQCGKKTNEACPAGTTSCSVPGNNDVKLCCEGGSTCGTFDFPDSGTTLPICALNPRKPLKCKPGYEVCSGKKVEGFDFSTVHLCCKNCAGVHPNGWPICEN